MIEEIFVSNVINVTLLIISHDNLRNLRMGWGVIPMNMTKNALKVKIKSIAFSL